MNQSYIDIKILFQLFNTHGTEKTPWSNIVSKNFYPNRIVSHLLAPNYWVPLFSFKVDDEDKTIT